MQGRELGRAKHRRLRHEIFPEQIGVLDHRALERLENNVASLELFGNDIAVNQLVAGEDYARGNFIEPPGLLENRGAIFVRERASELERR